MGSKYKDGAKSAKAQKYKPKTGINRVFEFPSNVRQIGGINKGMKIYIEDYAYTYIAKLGAKTGKEETAVFLIGYHTSELGEDILVISGAVTPPFAAPRADRQAFSEGDWRYARDTAEKYFPGLEIVGWARIQPGFGLYLNAADITSHYHDFEDKHSVLFLYDPEEKQNCFFAWNSEQDDLNEVAGYFIYYDKNQAMNTYVAETKNRGGGSLFPENDFNLEAGESEEGGTDDAEMGEVEFSLARSVEHAKRIAEVQRQKRIISMMTSVSVLLFFACVVMGVGLLQNGERLSVMETQMRELRTGYNNMVTKLNDSVFPAFAAQTARETVPVQIERETVQAEEPPAEAGETAYEQSLDDALGVAQEQVAMEPEDEPVTYVVQKGDTLTFISNKFYGVPNEFSRIMEANGISNPNMLVEGTTLIIPID